MEPVILVYIGAASAIGGLLGTLATMHVAKKQIHAQVVLGERMKWISLLRDSNVFVHTHFRLFAHHGLGRAHHGTTFR